MNQIACKVAPGAGRRLHDGAQAVARSRRSTRSSSPRSCDEAGVPPGVFNLVNGDGADVGAALSAHPGRRHGVVHRLDPRRHRGRQGRGRHREARRPGARRQVGQHHPRRRRLRRRRSPRGVDSCMCTNSGQSCNAPTRMLVPAAAHGRGGGDRRRRRPRRSSSATRAAPRHKHRPGRRAETQFDRIQRLIEKGIDEGAKLEAGGPGRPEGLDRLLRAADGVLPRDATT